MTTMMAISMAGGAMMLVSHILLEAVMMTTAKRLGVKWVELLHQLLSLLPHQPTITIVVETIAAVMTMLVRMMTAAMGAGMTMVVEMTTTMVAVMGAAMTMAVEMMMTTDLHEQ
jgi:hypothetical protein